MAEQAVIVDEEEAELQDVPGWRAGATGDSLCAGRGALRRPLLSELNRGSIRQIWNHVLRPDIYSPP